MCLGLIAILALATGVDPIPAADPPSGAEIMKNQRERHRLKDERVFVEMRLVSKLGREKVRTLSIDTLTTAEDRHKIMWRFLSPPDIAGTGLLIWETASGEDDQWLYLPASRKVKRIPASGKKNRFMGTDFAHEDMRPEPLGLHTYTLARSETLDGHDAFLIEARPATPERARDSGYSLRTLWIDKESLSTLKVEYTDKAGRPLKVLTPRQYVSVAGTAQRANELEMHDVQEGSRTIMRVLRRTANSGLKESLFTELELTRGGP